MKMQMPLSDVAQEPEDAEAHEPGQREEDRRTGPHEPADRAERREEKQ